MKSLVPALLCLATIALAGESPSVSADWLALPSTYTHDVATGQRVAQFAPIDAPTTAISQPLRTSGYTHYRSTLAYGQSADNYHRVEEWGDPVRPYGEWRFPYRPYSTPYPNWGQPYGGLNIGLGGGYGWNAPTQYGPGAGFNGQGFNGRGSNGQGPNPGGPQHGGPGTNPGGPGHPRGGGHNRGPNPAAGTNQFAPYPTGQGTPSPVAPY
ncbi:hypothetical protein RISK_003573 [Rhodopirellula islandica]|uniref:Signal peptide and transmembrane protein n=1 Tax=Rhodopirellula islandica TaxID=595434 RepID=A0A0J1EG59_RHOIS|nr:hypothetical protein [Rhodopirellula islandica]KLU04519.1 hypothetical protein RISK_003573 [Rhodopirellula islandica]